MGILRLSFVSACVLALCWSVSPDAQRTKASRGAPEVHSDLREETELRAGEDVRFTVTVVDPGDRVSLRLLDPPSGLIFHPVKNARSPSVSQVTWRVPSMNVAARVELHFEAQDSADVVTRFTLPVRIGWGNTGVAVLTGDVTGDGKLDVVAGASGAELGGHDRGAVFVWAGSRVPSGAPTAVLTAAAPADGARLGGWLQLGDVTGDGVLDIVAQARAIVVWEGGPGLSGAMHEHARLPGSANLQGSQLVDVTGDGVLDIVSASTFATVAGARRAGEGYVWLGGQTLSGTRAPDVRLSVPGAAANDEFTTLGLRAVDVTGDGLADLIGATRLVDGSGWAGGTAYVFPGGSGLSGSVAPVAALIPPSLGTGSLSLVTDIRFEDLTGDGVRDIVLVSPAADVGGVRNTGAIFVWAGGSPSGTPAPLATLTVPGAVADDGGTLRVAFADLTGDGVIDLLAREKWADVGGVRDTGSLFVWRGGATLSGPQPPSATLQVPGAGAGDQLDFDLFDDVTGDGFLDVVATSPLARLGGFMEVGELYVWSGGPTLSGTLAPTARLNVPGAQWGELNGSSVLCADVTGDGTPELVVSAPEAEINGVYEAGAIHVFPMGGALSGIVAPRASLCVPGAQTGDRLPLGNGAAVRLADVSGDGVLDIVASTYLANEERGAVYVWNGGNLVGRLAPTATLAEPGAEPETLLGLSDDEEDPIHFADVTRDGVLDLVVGAPHAYSGPFLYDAGAVLVWAGGAALRGTPAPRATLTAPQRESRHSLGNRVILSDVTGDGFPDILAGSPDITIDGVRGAGALFLWRIHPGRSRPFAVLADPAASAFDQLGL